MPAKLNILHKVFGRLTVIEYLGIDDTYSKWLCLCECGNKKEIRGRNLTSGSTKSCGCLQIESAISLNKTHGCSSRNNKTPEYKAWRAMVQRCTNPNTIYWCNYGGRGIKVCNRWLGENGFLNFLSDMGTKPTLGHTIDRFPNTDGNYESNNCRWATRMEQDRGKRSNRWLEHDGNRMILWDWAQILKTRPSAITRQLKIKPFSEVVKYYKLKNKV